MKFEGQSKSDPMLEEMLEKAKHGATEREELAKKETGGREEVDYQAEV